MFALWRSLSLIGRRLSLLTRLVNSPRDVLTNATRARPSWPSFNCITRPILHRSGRMPSSVISTTSSIERFARCCRHLPRGWCDATYSEAHRFQNWESSCWRARNRFAGCPRASIVYKQGCGIASNRLPLTSIDGISAKMSSGLFVRARDDCSRLVLFGKKWLSSPRKWEWNSHDSTQVVLYRLHRCFP